MSWLLHEQDIKEGVPILQSREWKSSHPRVTWHMQIFSPDVWVFNASTLSLQIHASVHTMPPAAWCWAWPLAIARGPASGKGPGNNEFKQQYYYSPPSHNSVAFPVFAYSSHPGICSVASLMARTRCRTCVQCQHEECSHAHLDVILAHYINCSMT